MSLSIPRVLAVAGLLLGAAVLLTGCPQPNAYTVRRAFPQLRFASMVGLQPIPGDGDHALLLTQDGIIRRANLADDAAAPTVFLDIRDRLIQSPGPEQGLLGLAFAPDYPASGRFYIYYTAGPPMKNTISRFVARGDAAELASERILLQINQPFQNHNGGSLAFGPDGYLYAGVGDGGSAGDPSGYGQRFDTLHGKILRIDVSGDAYTIPPDNPFAGQDARGEIYAYGLRNPWRMNFDQATGQLWTGDVGQNAWEEVDRIVAGGNYGWDRMEGAHCYEPPDGCDASGMLLPRVEYSHEFGCSITGGFVYRGREMPELTGWYIYGDYCSGRIWAVDAGTDSGAAIPIADTGRSIASFAQDKDGELYIVTFNNEIDKLIRK
ncbi:MAG: PQQ-dependent sugar dehydrogenase [Chloroflexota bacterium]